ncbi:50S ribosomal protein L21 [Buchnera aphidicola (Kurisakia onigurumii)]|uniref:50S ribosomal protein L21 n=1 Tax=Buchnera aphidicola TaxID=9 RepID=UPI0031B6AAF3
MYAVFNNGGKQYKVSEGDIIKLEKLNYESGKKIKFKKVMLISDAKEIYIGKPYLLDTNIEALIDNHGKGKKIKIIKFNCRKHYKKQQGHRQFFTQVKIIKINYNKKL